MGTEVSNRVSSNVPAFMQGQEVMGTELLNRYVRPPRLKIVQAMSGAPFNTYDQGTVLVVPQMLLFAGDVTRDTRKGALWHFVPLFFYPEWIQTTPMELKDKEPFVRARSLDPQSELAKKASNRETWYEPHPVDPSLKIANRECLNYVIMPYNHSLAGTMCVLTFARAAFREGANLASMIKLRKAPIFGQVFEANTNGNRKNAKGAWWGLDINIPSENPWVTAEEFEAHKALHTELVAVHKSGLLQVDYDDVSDDENATSSTQF